MKKLFLLDAMALIYRSHFAFSKTPRINSKGLNTGAVFGFMNTVLEVIEKEKPTHIGVAFDTAEPTFRHIQYAEYKAHRQAQPEDITIGIPYAKKLLEAMNIPILVKPGFEADDIIGTLAKKASSEGFVVYMMTPDKDYGQLVEENIWLYKPSYMGKGVEIMGVKEVLEKWGIKEISQVTDILGLQGDSSDNIPGIPSIGEKTAQKLIEEYESVENLIANADKLAGKLKENVIKYADQGILSKQLAIIDINVPVEFEEENLLLSEVSKDELVPLLDELEFRNIKKRLFGDDTESGQTPANTGQKKKNNPPTGNGQMDLFSIVIPPKVIDPETQAIIDRQIQEINEIFGEATSADTGSAQITSSILLPEKNTIDTVIHRYHLINTPELRQILIDYLLKQAHFCFDTETTKLDPVEAHLIGMSFCAYEKEAYYVPMPEDLAEAQVILEAFRPVFENEAIGKSGQNMKFDIIVLKKYNIEIKGELFDTMLADYLVAPEGRHNMDDMAEKYLNYIPVPIESLIGKKGKNQLSMKDVDIEKIKEYAAEDADITFQLRNVLLPKIKKTESEQLFYDVEMPLMPVLAEIENIGIKIDKAALNESSEILAREVQEIEASIYQLAGESFNIASPKQLGTILFEKLNLDPKAKKTATGQYATGEDILTRLSDKHEIIDKILDYRELQKLKSTYIDALPELINPVDGRVHTSFNQAVTATGRLSSTNPNLQNIPIRTDRGKEIRKAFVAKDNNHLILSADYSQIELRLMAAFSKDPTMMEAFSQGLDIHASTASKVFKVDINEVNSDLRRKAKTVNFGIIYGISAHGLAQRLDIPRKEAGEIIRAYFEQFPLVKTYMDSAIERARETGYAQTKLGRKRYLPDIHSVNNTLREFAERNAINTPLQGTAAEIIKLAMIRIYDWMQKEKLQSKMILQVHDELVFDAHKDEIEILKTNITELMKNALPLEVPMEVGIGIGENWLEAH
jgi:DNA polymerase-1